MVLFRATGDECGWILSLGFLLLAATHVPVANGQQVGVSLKLRGVTIPSDSLVDLDEILYTAFDSCCNVDPSNANPTLHDQALLCVTDLEDCCESPKTVHGDWYYPDGSRVEFNTATRITFRRNRGPNEIRNDRHFYGSVRLFRRFSRPPGGRFRCELPSATNPSINQTLYANIVDFGADLRVDPVTISPSGSSTAGRNFSLMCSATTFESRPLPSDVPRPTFGWLFGLNNSSLPSGVTPTTTTLGSGNTYTSTLQFSPLSQSHAGMYRCWLGAGILTNHAMVTVNRPPTGVRITANLNEPLMVGQTDNTLTCDVSGADNLNPMITYQWTRNDGSTQTPVGTNSNALSLSPLRLSNAGDYTCSVTVSSTLLSNDIITSPGNPQRVMIQIPDPQSVFLTSNQVDPNVNGDGVILICTVNMRQEILDSEIFLLMVDAQLSQPDGTPLALTGPTVTGTTFTYTTRLKSFGRSDSGNYTCMATIRPQPSSVYLHGTGELSNTTRITTGVYFSSRSSYVNKNSNILLTDVGEGDCGALLCYTDLMDCCGDSDTPVGVGTLGQWLYPNGSAVGVVSDGQDFYIDRGPSVVRLNRRNNATSTTGQFCCEVPDATSTTIRSCVNIVIVPQCTQVSSTVCTSEVAIGVVATILIECLLAAPIIAVVLALCWKRRKSSDKNTNVILNGGGVTEEVYEEPDKLGAIATTAPGNFALTDCPAYGTTTHNIQPHPTAAADSSNYEL